MSIETIQQPTIITQLPELWAPNILIVGPSGSGKSTSLETLPQDESTALLLTEPKALPFPHKFTNITIVEEHDKFIPALKKLKADPRVKRIAIDSLSKQLERCLAYCRTFYKNYDIWSSYGRLGFALLAEMSDKTKPIIAISIDESVEQEVVDSNKNGELVTIYKKMAAVGMGKELLGKIEKEFVIVAHCMCRKNLKTGLMEHVFLVKPSPTTTAKSPRSMFDKAADGFIPNDCGLILKEAEVKGLLKI